MRRDTRQLVISLAGALGMAAIAFAADYATARWVPEPRRSALGGGEEVRRGGLFGIEWGRRTEKQAWTD